MIDTDRHKSKGLEIIQPLASFIKFVERIKSKKHVINTLTP